MESITFGELIAAIIAVAFGAWAGVVAWLGHGIRQDIHLLSRALNDQGERLNSYILQTETRLALLEERISISRNNP